jgi:hypothetical protein
VPAAGVGSDGQKHGPKSRDQPGAGGEINVALLADRILRAVTVAIVVRVVEQGVHGLVAAQVYDAENLPSSNRESTVRRRNFFL